MMTVNTTYSSVSLMEKTQSMNRGEISVQRLLLKESNKMLAMNIKQTMVPDTPNPFNPLSTDTPRGAHEVRPAEVPSPAQRKPR